jgi:hypothetical protein
LNITNKLYISCYKEIRMINVAAKWLWVRCLGTNKNRKTVFSSGSMPNLSNNVFLLDAAWPYALFGAHCGGYQSK